MSNESTTNVYHGSCHCGDVQYQVRLTFPPLLTADRSAKTIRIYKCNCTVCQKMGFFHLRPISFTEDFILTSPSSPEELGDYRCFAKKTGWYFCKKCGVRTFGVSGIWKQDEMDVGQWAGKEKDGELKKVWKSVPGEVETTVNGEKTTRTYHYVSINAVTLDTGDNGVDLAEWHEKGWIFYVDALSPRDKERAPKFGQPHECGMY